MEYIGEQLLPGQIGHFFVVLSFVAALFSAFSYFMATKMEADAGYPGWLRLGRYGFLFHGLSTFGVIIALFYILTGKLYEYQYAWANVSDDLPFKYVFSAFWKEQQGSFLLWSFWHIVLGMVLILKSGKWESAVMAVIALAEAIIASMILGLYFGDFRLGASPFDLLRDVMDAPIFAQADYLEKVKGNGLNPLLQNYWMTIHPPTLFLGFASTIVPFAFAIAGLWKKEHKEWLKPALNWALFSGAILGLGILMGGVWAYEALSFGGYWAWDPVENTSLVPWLTLVAGIHTNLVARSTGYSIRSTYGFYLVSFILILYSTYLTRSGILGDTSAHAFTEMGLGFQLILFIGAFSLLSLLLFGARAKGIPSIQEEEKFASREFWMFMGSLVLLFSAVLLTGATSLPVWNKLVQLFKEDYVGAALKDPVEHHNRYQMWIAVFIGVLSGVAQWLRYSERNWSVWVKKFGLHLGIALVLATILTFFHASWIKVSDWRLAALLFTAMFTLSSNADYLISFAKGNLKMAASAVSHLGFGILILGVMSSGLNKEWISSNNFAMEGLIEGMDNEDLNRNVLLIREAPMPIKRNFEATYVQDTIERQTRTFTVQFKKRDEAGNPTGEEFVLHPNVMYDRPFTKVVASNPSTKHYWNYDIFTHVSSLPKAELDPEYAQQQEDSLKYQLYDAVAGDTLFTKEHYIVVQGLTKDPVHPEYKKQPGDLAFGLKMKAYSLEDRTGYDLNPMMYLRPGEGAFALAYSAPQLEIKAKLTEKGLEKALKMEEELQYQTFQVKQGASFSFQGYEVKLVNVNREIKHPNYVPQQGDIAVAAELEVLGNGASYQVAPVFLIRGNQPLSLKSELMDLGLHFVFQSVDPETGLFTIRAAKSNPQDAGIPVEIAENAGRSDYIVLEAIIFPGINFVWAGSLLMLFGLALGFWRRWRQG